MGLAAVIELDQIVVPPSAFGERFDPRELFEPGTPVELEIGCGKGGFLVDRATTYPERGFLGIEWANEYFRYAADRMARRNLANVRLMRTDAAYFVIHHLMPECLSALHVYHPDPWPKRRHHKRRLFQTPFVEAALRSLRSGGRWWIQTDHAEYFDRIRELLDGRALLEEVPFEEGRGETLDPATNFQVKYARQGRSIYRRAYRKR